MWRATSCSKWSSIIERINPPITQSQLYLQGLLSAEGFLLLRVELVTDVVVDGGHAHVLIHCCLHHGGHTLHLTLDATDVLVVCDLLLVTAEDSALSVILSAKRHRLVNDKTTVCHRCFREVRGGGGKRGTGEGGSANGAISEHTVVVQVSG